MAYDFSQRPRVELPKIPRGAIQAGAIGLVAVILLAGTVFQIRPEEIGVILRFGKYVRTAEPGLHFKLPLGMETLTRVPVQRQLKLEFGFRTVRPGVNSEYMTDGTTRAESVMLTGDLNVVVAEWIVQYKIKDPDKFLFKMRDATGTLRDMTEAAVRRVVGDSSVDEVLTIGRARLAGEAKAILQDLCNLYEIGIEIDQLIFQDVNPPDPVKPSFNDVNEALQEKERKINEAWAEYNQEIPKAQGEAQQVVQAAEGYATERVNNAQGDAQRFRAIFEEYRKAPSVTRKRLYLEALNEILPKMGRKIVLDGGGRSVLPLLDLGKEASK